MRDMISTMAQSRHLALPPGGAEKFEMYYRLLLEGNKRMNLTRIIEPEEVVIKHFIDSLELLLVCKDVQGPLLDVGTGAGVPGIPLKIARPDLKLTLLDSSKKRVSFLSEVVETLRLPDVDVIHGRAEDYAQQNRYREQYATVVSRAVARLNVLAELCLPFVAVDGHFVAYKGPEGGDELQQEKNAIAQLGGLVGKKWEYQLPETMGDRTLLFFQKKVSTPKKYPRKAGTPEKRPLL